MVKRVFVSFPSSTQDLAQFLVAFLAQHEFDPLTFHGLSPGIEIRPWIESSIRTADGFVFIVEPHPVSSNLRFEWSAAIEESWRSPSKAVVPLVIEGASTPAFLRGFRSVRIRKDRDSWPKAFSRVRTLLLREVVPTALGKHARQQLSKRLEELGSVAGELDPTHADLEAERDALEKEFSVRLAEQGPHHPDVLRCAHNLAMLLRRLGDIEGSKHFFKYVLENVVDREGLADLIPASEYGLGLLLFQSDDIEPARVLLASALAHAQARLPEDAPLAAAAGYNLGQLFRRIGEDDKALHFLKLAGQLSARSLGQGHPATKYYEDVLSSLEETR